MSGRVASWVTARPRLPFDARASRNGRWRNLRPTTCGSGPTSFWSSAASSTAGHGAGGDRGRTGDGERRACPQGRRPVARDAAIEADEPYPCVSRGGLKLAAALDAFAIDPAAVSASMLAPPPAASRKSCSRAARPASSRSMSGSGQLHRRSSATARSWPREHRCAQPRPPSDPRTADLLVADVSFISLQSRAAAAVALLAPRAAPLARLIKPQFEAGPAHVRKGIVRDEACAARLRRHRAFVSALGFDVVGIRPRPSRAATAIANSLSARGVAAGRDQWRAPRG